MPGTRIRRDITIGNPTCLLGFSGRDSVDSGVLDSSTIALGGIDEVQTITLTGGPTGGSFKLVVKNQTTGAITAPGTAAAIQTALRALSRVGPGITVTGSAGGPYTVTFSGTHLGKKQQALMTTTAVALTGGTTPAVSVTEATQGSSLWANLYVIRSGTPLMASGDGTKLVQWDGASATTLVGIFDGQIELLDPSDTPVIPVYNHECVFDKDKVLNYTTWSANYLTWAAAHACQFKSQGT